MSDPSDEQTEKDAAGQATAEFGSCCTELEEALVADGFDPLITVSDNGVIYLTVGLVDQDGGDGAALVDHPMFYCPFCGTALQSRADVKQKISDGDN